jgi:protein-tyrosine-phosphatase
MTADPIRLGFVCVQNAGRSQMATAFAVRERDRRGLTECLEIHSGGTEPADAVHDVVVEAMAEVGIDISDRTPTAIDTDTIESCTVVATMGCSTLQLDADSTVDVRDWALPDPHGEELEAVREIRETIESRVRELFDEIVERQAAGD